jgi:hypothetical protein
VGSRASVLPYAIVPDADRWVLKMHGCVSHPEDIVLTREDQIGFERRNAALAGIAQTLLITRHMVFVGFSLSDDNFHRIADAVRRVVRTAGGAEGKGKPFGTALVLERSRLVEELWRGDLEWVGMADPPAGGDGEEDARRESARRLEVFLDYLLAQTRETAHLLDDRYRAVLTRPETALREALLRFVGGCPPRRARPRRGARSPGCFRPWECRAGTGRSGPSAERTRLPRGAAGRV